MATIKDVARKAGVSTSTVSHVINQNRFVSTAIQQRVTQAIEQLNYTPSALARSLKLNQTRTIGMLVTTSSNPFYAEIVKGVEDSCYERGYSLILCNTADDEQRMSRSLETLIQKRVDGLLLMCNEGHAALAPTLQRYPSLPIVMMDWSPLTGLGDVIEENALFGGELATLHLIKRGYQRIACITGPLDKSTAKRRLAGFKRALLASGRDIDENYIIQGDFEFSGGMVSMEALLALSPRPDAVFACNDAMAVGVYQALFRAGLTIPDDIAVIGYDDIALSEYLTPPLTTIHQPKDSLGLMAIDLLLHRIESKKGGAPVSWELTPELVSRSST
ncbi:transcriptional regulator RbsR [Tatumella sp. TA1]|uniref:ribose operon transcriptional repressor RbsR n=1 Tax=Rosenbergiella collisarenosi TaxID=1544695 RepID=UPI0012FE1796|nr:ribose operon transcriptional repressor RbsR [Rosenbergiella collisarenosi]MBT0721852.1 ribose operon transcriptional repressor RbsR [Rosenbergiella collisarenosi]QGX92991.1 transcriptional regulator RbsR [Tatumella sp. TA1]